MKERPILFSAPMVKALLAGTKTQTRRIVKLPDDHPEFYVDDGGTEVFGPGPYLKFPATDTQIGHGRLRCPYGYPGDRLWVKEAWQAARSLDVLSPSEIGKRSVDAGYSKPWAPLRYLADGHTSNADVLRDFGGAWGKTRVSIHMPRWASRMTLEITEVRVQRLHDITEEDARAEGVAMDCDRRWWLGVEHPIKGTPKVYPTARQAFESLWVSINGADSWAANPWVWALTFTPVEPTS